LISSSKNLNNRKWKREEKTFFKSGSEGDGGEGEDIVRQTVLEITLLIIVAENTKYTLRVAKNPWPKGRPGVGRPNSVSL
jgi:hypothetical protein